VNGGSLADKITFYQKPYLRMGEPTVKQHDGDTLVVQIKIEQYVVLDIPLKDESKRPEIEKMLAQNLLRSSITGLWIGTITARFSGVPGRRCGIGRKVNLCLSLLIEF